MPSKFDYTGLGDYGYQPMAPFAMTQPAPIPSWMPAPVQQSFPYAASSGYGAMEPFDYGLGSQSSSGGLGLTAPNTGLPSLPNANNNPGGASNWFRDSGFLSQKNLDGTTTQGWGGLALGGAQALGSMYMGMKQYGLAKDTLAANKSQFERNYAAQRTTTNTALEDRQRARVASNPNAYQSVGDYMQKNGVR